MLRIKGHFTLAELHCRPMVTQKTTEMYAAELERAGYVRRVGGGVLVPGMGAKRSAVVYQRTSNAPEAPRLNDGQASTSGFGRLAMWRAMRRLTRGFTADELVRAASVDGVLQVSRATAVSYAQTLARAGYLKPVARQPGTPTRWRLVNDTGPHAPAITRRKCVFDRNTGTFADLETPQEVCDALD
ncbi:hypothetical protein [Pseudacidovorax intermedius]|uniref:hypothetical protein n=1 Tax=Pseudacidovorax intermedius TaxID=433924 RepID=UPI0026EDC28A|nr:hypothetical protein [Pseudacidovorax intermedius]